MDKPFEDKLISYPFPLRKDKIVYLYLPIDMTVKEAKKIFNYIKSLIPPPQAGKSK